MLKININQNQFSDLLNLIHKVFYPLKNFVDKKQFINILKKNKFGNFFFPFPIYFGVDKQTYKKIKNEKKLILKYNNKSLLKLKKLNFFDIDKNYFGKKIYGKNYKKHPYFKKFFKENYKFLSFKFDKLNKEKIRDKRFISPKHFKKRFRINNKKYLAGFHTRNVPHKAHEWIHMFMMKKYKSLLIQPLIGQYKVSEYKDSVIIKTNKILIKSYKTKKVYLASFFSYPRYGGPLEAALHAIVRKNYGCTHFWVGRDHAGYRKFFNTYSSQKYCVKNEKRIGIKIISEKEPYFCHGCKKVVNSRCVNNKCNLEKKEKISGTKIRKLIYKRKKIPEHLLYNKIIKVLSRKSLLTNNSVEKYFNLSTRFNYDKQI